MDTIESKLAQITRIDHGKHTKPEQGMCVMEAISFIAGEPFSDAPKCVPGTIAAASRRLNDSIKDTDLRTEIMRPLIVRMFGLSIERDVEARRAYIAADHVTRVTAPMVMEATGWTDLAERARAIPPIVDKTSAQAGRTLMLAIREETWSRRKAADAAAYAAYAYAAYAAYAAAAYAADAADAYADAADAAAYAAAAAAYAQKQKWLDVRNAIYRSSAEMIVKMCEAQ